MDGDGGVDAGTLIENGLEILRTDECRSLLETGFIGRVGIDVGAVPAILPVRYALAGDDIVFRTGEGLKLGAATEKRTVAFEVDQYDRAVGTGWSVLVVGAAQEIDDSDLFPAEAGRLRPAAPGDRRHVVRITLDVITGRRFGWGPG